EPLEPLLDVPSEQSRPPAVVLEDEHADVPCLAIAARREADRPGALGSAAQRVDDRLELPGRPPPEAGECDVQGLSWNDADVAQLLSLPAREFVEDAVAQAQREKEPDSFIAAHASGRGHASSSRLPVRSARRR